MHAVAKRKILMVVHGPGRGRHVPTGDVFLKRLVATNDPLFHDIRIHATCTGTPDFSDIGTVLFWLGDPLKQKYPTCYLDAMDIAKEAAFRGLKMINHPDGLSNTSKTSQARIWNECGVPSANVAPVRDMSQLPAAIEAIGYPCIVRGDEEHAQRDVAILRDKSDLDRMPPIRSGAAAVLRMHDIRQEYRDSTARCSDLFRRYHHKARAFVFGDQVMASHLFFSESPIVGLSNCLFTREAGRVRSLARKAGYNAKLLDELIAVDQQYFATPVFGRADLVAAVRALGLDFAAVDYSLRPNGQVIIWEANPYFWLPDGVQSVLSEERRAVDRVNRSFDWMATCLKSSAAQQSPLSVVTAIPA